MRIRYDMRRRTLLRLGGLGGVTLLSGCTGEPKPNGISNPSGSSQNSTTTSPQNSTATPEVTPQAAPNETPEMVEKTFSSEYYSGDQQFTRTACDSSEDEFVTLVEAGRGRYLLGVGLNGTIGCEEVTVLDNRFEPETREYNVRLSFKPRSGANDCDSGCTVTYFLYASYIATSTTKLIKNMTVTVERVDETTVFNPVEPE
jgi:hypothetical protein